MSVSDPLLKQLKDHIFDLRRHSLVLAIDDCNGVLRPFCTTLEQIFRKGLRTQKSTPLGTVRRDYWNCFYSMLQLKRNDKLPLRLAMSIQTVKDFKKVQTAQGKGRLLLRVLLKKHMLRTAVSCLLQCPSLVAAMYCPCDSIMGNEILAEILLSLLYAVDKISFHLTLRNATFLDTTWHLGMYKSFEFVPCETLGISVGFAAGIPVVTGVDEGSVAGEDDKIQPGDVLDDLYGEPLKGRKRGTISTLLEHFRGMPVYLSVVKSYQHDGTAYGPVSELLNGLRLVQPPRIEPRPEPSSSSPDLFADSLDGSSGMPVNTPQESVTYKAVYLGKTYVGNAGRVLEIDKSIDEVCFKDTDGHLSYQHDGTAYGPVSELLNGLRLVQPPRIEPRPEPSSSSPDLFADSLDGSSGMPVNTPQESVTYKAVYLGKTYVGNAGRVLEIDKSIDEVCFKDTDGHLTSRIPVWLDLSDCHFKVLSRLSKEVVLEKHFTEIASCGKSNSLPCVFAVVAGETTCTISKHFYCYVFEVQLPKTSETLLYTIAQGFTRTSWSV